MLGETLCPRGLSASLTTMGTLSEGNHQVVTFLPHLLGYWRWDTRSGHSKGRARQLLGQLLVARYETSRANARLLDSGRAADPVRCRPHRRETRSAGSFAPRFKG